MADIYVRSTDGNDADNGSTWALAKATLAGAAAIDAAGDKIYVSDNHAESTAASITLAFAGTRSAPTYIYCGDDAAQPPTTSATTGTVTTTGASSITINGNLVCTGLTLQCGTGAVNATLTVSNGADDFQQYKDCKFRIVATGAASRLAVGPGTANQAPPVAVWENCSVRFAASAQGISAGMGVLLWRGGSVESGGTSPTTLFPATTGSGRTFMATLEGVDLSNLSSTANLVGVGSTRGSRFKFINCRLPASWTGSPVTGTIQSSDRVEMYNCDSGNTNYKIWVQDYAGAIVDETIIVRTGGASDGTTTMSWKMVSTADAEYPHITLNTPEIVRWNETTGSSITVTVETITDNVTLTDAECWLEVQYLGTSGVPLGSFISDAKADVLATAANQTTSSETWTTTGLTTPVKQKLSVSFTPQEKGYIHAVVKLAKASTTVYVDPELTVT